MVKAPCSVSIDLVEHPAAAVFPLMVGAEFEALCADMRANGQLEAIIIDAEGRVLDGRNRWRACRAIGVVPQTDAFTGGDPVAFVLSKNLYRRHLDESQRAMVGGKLANMSQGRPKTGKFAGLSEKGSSKQMISQKEAADMVNVSERSVRSARKVIEKGDDEMIAAVEAGDITVSRAAVGLKRPNLGKKPEPAQAPISRPIHGSPVAGLIARTAEDIIRTGEALEASGQTVETVAKELEIGIGHYRNLRQIAHLSKLEFLRPDDADRVRQALALVNELKQVNRAYKSIEDLVALVYGSAVNRRGKNVTLDRLVKRRHEQFDRAISLVNQTCRNLDLLECPYVGPSDAVATDRKLAEAMDSLRKFRASLKGKLDG